MNSLIEEYLADVAAHLTVLPVSRRNDEVREMRQHLMSTVEAHLELGVTEQEAVESTLHQFGSAAEAANGLSNAWRRRQGTWMDVAKVGLFGAVALWSVLAFCTLLGQYVAERSNALTAMLSPHFQPISYILLYGISALSGNLLGKRFAKETIKAIAWGTVLGYAAPLVLITAWNTSDITAWYRSDIIPVSLIALFQAACLNGAVWAVRLRQRRMLLAGH